MRQSERRERRNLNTKYLILTGDREGINSSSIKKRFFFVETAQREGMVGPLSPEQKQVLENKYNVHLEIEYKTRQISENMNVLMQAKVWGYSPVYIANMQQSTEILVNERDALIKAAKGC